MVGFYVVVGKVDGGQLGGAVTEFLQVLELREVIVGHAQVLQV